MAPLSICAGRMLSIGIRVSHLGCRLMHLPRHHAAKSSGIRAFFKRQWKVEQASWRKYYCSTVGAEKCNDSTDFVLQNLLDNVKKIRLNVNHRQLNIDVDNLVRQVRNLKKLHQQKVFLENQRRENADLVKSIVKNQGQRDFLLEKEELSRRGQELRRNLKQLMENEYRTLYNEVMSSKQDLPTDLHSSTLEKDQIIHETGSRNDAKTDLKNHLQLTEGHYVFHLRGVGNQAYYLFDKLAQLEQKVMYGISDLLRSNGLQQLVGPDIVKRSIAEGCGIKENEGFEIEGQGESGDGSASLVLTGVSCSMFSAYLSSLTLEERLLPLLFYAVGCGYSPGEQSPQPNRGLHNVPQASKADVYGCVRNAREADVLFASLLNICVALYDSLDLHVRFVQVSASQLKPMEAKRVDMFIWSEGFQEYMKCGELCLCNDYISRRLMMKYSNDKSTTDSFLYTVHGTVMKIPSLLACIIEKHQTADIARYCQNFVSSSTDRSLNFAQ